MAYQATTYRVFIASPSDVSTERQVARDIVHEWNAIYSKDRSIVLMPVSWETHAAPAMGAPPQDIINQQILDDCDLLVAIFWTRLGSPTSKGASGTVEEIEKHISAGKPAMIYFSNAPVRPDSVDKSQYDALVEFRTKCQERGLVQRYDSISDFRDKLQRHLAQTVIRQFAGQSDSEVGVIGPPIPESVRTSPVLSDHAGELLLAAADDPNGHVLKFRTSGGLMVQSNRRQFVERGNPRSEALWESAIQELCKWNLLEARGVKGEVFGITHEGYQAADFLKQNRPGT